MYSITKLNQLTTSIFKQEPILSDVLKGHFLQLARTGFSQEQCQKNFNKVTVLKQREQQRNPQCQDAF